MNSSAAEYDLVIIGAGIIGASIAFAASKRGLRSLNIDALPSAGYGSTSNSSAIVRPIYSHFTTAALAHECRSHWKNWQTFLGLDDGADLAQYHECGGLVLMPDGHEADYQGNIDAMTAAGVEFEIINASAISKRYPDIDLNSYGPPRLVDDAAFCLNNGGKVSAAIHVPAAGFVSDPQLAARNLSTAAIQHGAKFLYNNKVVAIDCTTAIDRRSVSSITLADGAQISVTNLINAAGPHSSRINQLLGLDAAIDLKTQAVRHEVNYLKATGPRSGQQHFSQRPGFLVDLDAGLYSRPDGNDIMFGSTDPACDESEIVDPDNYNTEFSSQWTLQAMRAGQRFPHLGISNQARGVVGLYDVSKDWIPIYDRTDIEGYFVAIGTSGNQFKNGPLIGEIMCNIIALGNRHDTHPATLSLPQIDRSIDLSFFSRKRQAQATHSVLA